MFPLSISGCGGSACSSLNPGAASAFKSFDDDDGVNEFASCDTNGELDVEPPFALESADEFELPSLESACDEALAAFGIGGDTTNGLAIRTWPNTSKPLNDWSGSLGSLSLLLNSGFVVETLVCVASDVVSCEFESSGTWGTCGSASPERSA